MASIADRTYDGLVASVGNWLFGRTDLAVRVPDFVALTEAHFNRTLFTRQMETRAIATLDTTSDEPEFLALPADFQTMRRVRLIGIDGSTIAGKKPRLTFRTGAQMDDERDAINDNPGPPVFFGLFGCEMELVPTPDQNYQVEMVYRSNLPALGTSNETNWLLTMAPDAYLYGALMQAAPYLMDDERVPVWSAALEKAIGELNDLSEKALYDAGPLVMRSRRKSY